MQLDDVVRYAKALGWSNEDLIALLAKKRPRVAIKRLLIKIYTDEGYKRLFNLLGEIGQEHLDFDT
mgnify:CR=1 FL=1|nr:hypothetical protein [Bacteroides coprosuis]